MNRLKVSVKKASLVTNQSYQIILLEWKDCGENFLDRISFSRKRDDVQIHVFFNKTDDSNGTDQMHDSRRALKEVAVFHESLTDAKEASWTDLLAYLINFYSKTTVSCHHCVSAHPKPIYHVTLVSRDQGKYKELKALLKSNKTETKVVDGWKITLLDLFPHVCTECHIIFGDEQEADLHDKEDHNYLCENESCERSRRENGFYSQRELIKHKRRQQQCQFCRDKIFCDVAKYNSHMNKRHIYCDCSCEKYYKTFEEFIAHYGGVYPLPCLEGPECKTRFKNIDEQAFHHKTAHGSKYPYYCLACFGNQILTCLRTSDELMTHVSDVKHKRKEFHLVMIPDEKTMTFAHENNSSDNSL